MRARALARVLQSLRGLGLGLGLGGCAAAGTAPPVAISTVFADGRSCRDASVTTIELGYGPGTPPRWTCLDAVPPLAIQAVDLPLSFEVEVRALSAQGAALYRGRLVAAEALAAPVPAVTVTLYPAAVR